MQVKTNGVYTINGLLVDYCLLYDHYTLFLVPLTIKISLVFDFISRETEVNQIIIYDTLTPYGQRIDDLFPIVDFN